jgi:hypothetical protein
MGSDFHLQQPDTHGDHSSVCTPLIEPDNSWTSPYKIPAPGSFTQPQFSMPETTAVMDSPNRGHTPHGPGSGSQQQCL